MTEYRSIAYCQAGHAVAARLRTDCPIDTVTIPPGEPSVSALVREHLLGEFDLEHEPDDEIRRIRGHIEDAIFVSLAGPYAQRRHDPSSTWRSSEGIKEASDLIHCVNRHELGPARVVPLFRRYINARVNNFLELHWSPIEALAHRLILDRTASRDEAAGAAVEIALTDLADTYVEHRPDDGNDPPL